MYTAASQHYVRRRQRRARVGVRRRTRLRRALQPVWRGPCLGDGFGGRRRWAEVTGAPLAHGARLPAPEETTIGVDIAYASTKFRVPEGYDEPERLLVFMGPPPDFPNGAVMEIIEHQTWHVTLMGRFGDYPPHDAAGFLAFAQALHTPKLYDLIKDAERVADITAYRFPRASDVITNG